MATAKGHFPRRVSLSCDGCMERAAIELRVERAAIERDVGIGVSAAERAASDASAAAATERAACDASAAMCTTAAAKKSRGSCSAGHARSLASR